MSHDTKDSSLHIERTVNVEAKSIDDTIKADAPNVETKDVVTPYAFGVADELLGIRLATPFQRGTAQCIDLLCVVILSSLNTLFLAIIATATFYKASRNLENKTDRRTTRTFLKLGGAVMLIWTLLLILDVTFDEPHPQYDVDDVPAYVEPSMDEYPEDGNTSPAKHSSTHSLIEWAKGIIADLGLGFGWAALYYSVFTAWFNGKTPGKRLMHIQVLKLDGNGLTLWESFGRYGGYGAGLATGLLGFLQICWDPNRQAIQDKISETLVIQGRR